MSADKNLYRVWPDGWVQDASEEPPTWRSDDFVILAAEDEDAALAEFERRDADARTGGLSLNWAAASVAELRRLHAENAALQQGYDAARLEINHFRGVTKMVEPAQPVAWLVYLPSEDAQRIYDSQDDIGYVDDLTNNADAKVSPLYTAQPSAAARAA